MDKVTRQLANQTRPDASQSGRSSHGSTASQSVHHTSQPIDRGRRSPKQDNTHQPRLHTTHHGARGQGAQHTHHTPAHTTHHSTKGHGAHTSGQARGKGEKSQAVESGHSGRQSKPRRRVAPRQNWKSHLLGTPLIYI